ncbi:hypothetical protein PIB30_092375 [Stylosanthes scabra]|uniref:SWIM-type domain-containing protein n=1 Tax=Stylosanthes scabra TaxID=79078 RepID=A0ABU6WYB1_9FABA|nr:hypothetical protein [Stylosanthes scabra]
MAGSRLLVSNAIFSASMTRSSWFPHCTQHSWNFVCAISRRRAVVPASMRKTRRCGCTRSLLPLLRRIPCKHISYYTGPLPKQTPLDLLCVPIVPEAEASPSLGTPFFGSRRMVMWGCGCWNLFPDY